MMNEEMEMLALLQADIAERLGPVRGGMSDDAFNQLVRDIAAVKLKYGAETDLFSSLRSQLQTLLANEPHQSPGAHPA